MTKFESLLKDYEAALKRFEEVLREKKSGVVRDSTIKRFEIVFELSWKTLKAALEEFHNARCTSPQTCFREAFQQGLIEHDDFWIEMAKWRNESVHIYREELADALYAKLPASLNYFQIILRRLKKEIKREGGGRVISG